MDSLEDNSLCKFRTDTLEIIRKQYNLDKPGAMGDVIDILVAWIQMQEHFVKKDFDRGYLERIVIRSKGSVEKAKVILDRICTSRVLLPNFFGIYNIKDFDLSVIEDCILPNLTEQSERVYIMKNYGQSFTPELIRNFYLRSIYTIEYLCKYDYCNGLVSIIDYSTTNLVEMIKCLDLVEMRQFFEITLKSYGLRLKALHVISSSKVIHAFVTILKQMLSEKLRDRIHIHSSVESVKELVDRKILPVEYGGLGPTRKELHQIYLDAISTEDFMSYIKNSYTAKTNEAFRQTATFNDQYLGTPGSFRTLRVD
ncbi:hypothetical protein ACJJTC_001523 [Scirpophaga incertulas]